MNDLNKSNLSLISPIKPEGNQFAPPSSNAIVDLLNSAISNRANTTNPGDSPEKSQNSLSLNQESHSDESSQNSFKNLSKSNLKNT